jgi:hypothetical protein
LQARRLEQHLLLGLCGILIRLLIGYSYLTLDLIEARLWGKITSAKGGMDDMPSHF